MDQYVQSAVKLSRRVNQRRGALRLGQIAGNCVNPQPLPAQPRGAVPRFLLLLVGNHHRGAEAGEGGGNRQANALGAAGHQHHPAAEGVGCIGHNALLF